MSIWGAIKYIMSGSIAMHARARAAAMLAEPFATSGGARKRAAIKQNNALQREIFAQTQQLSRELNASLSPDQLTILARLQAKD